MRHNRKLVIGGVALVKARLKNTGPALVFVSDEIEKVLVGSDFFAQAPFKCISLIIRYGLKNKFEPVYQRINKTHGDLPIALEVDTHEILGADVETVKQLFRKATLQALLHVAEKYDLPRTQIREFQERVARQDGSVR